MNRRRGGRMPRGGYQPDPPATQGTPPQGGSGVPGPAGNISVVPNPSTAVSAPPVPVGDAVQATVVRAAPAAPPAPPRPKVYMCYGHPGITREITAENLVLNGPPFCTQCGIRMAEDLTGRL